MGKPQRRPQKPKSSREDVRRIQELRRSNAAGSHGKGKYTRKEKYRDSWED